MSDTFDYASVGGKRIKLGKGGSEVLYFGWLPPENRSQTQEASDAAARSMMPRFAIGGTSRLADNPKQALLYESWKHPLVVAANGRPFTGIKQVTGSCVGAGGGTAWMTLACQDAVRRGDPETPLIPFWLLPYGRSRFYLGDRSPGEGSTGSTFAKAAREDGTLPANTPGLPQPQESDGMLTWGSSVEMSWSDGDAQQTMNLLSTSRKHLVKTTAQCRDANDVREAIVNGFPCTAASMYAHDGGTVKGTPAVLVGRRRGSWSHQMSITAWMEHPTEGELFYLMNQWGASSHGRDPFGAPAGGVWITASDVTWICRDEVYAFSQFDGFPAPAWDIPWCYL